MMLMGSWGAVLAVHGVHIFRPFVNAGKLVFALSTLSLHRRSVI